MKKVNSYLIKKMVREGRCEDMFTQSTRDQQEEDKFSIPRDLALKLLEEIERLEEESRESNR